MASLRSCTSCPPPFVWPLARARGGGCSVQKITLSPDLSCGYINPRPLANPLFDVQTTMIRKGNSLYVVNAKFGTDDADVATTPYEILRVDRDDGELVCTDV